jgi:hypothetical protein
MSATDLSTKDGRIAVLSAALKGYENFPQQNVVFQAKSPSFTLLSENSYDRKSSLLLLPVFVGCNSLAEWIYCSVPNLPSRDVRRTKVTIALKIVKYKRRTVEFSEIHFRPVSPSENDDSRDTLMSAPRAPVQAFILNSFVHILPSCTNLLY